MIIYKNDYLRISLITTRLIRTETSTLSDVKFRGEFFTDLPTQTVQNRDFCQVKYSLEDCGNVILVKTDSCLFKVNK